MSGVHTLETKGREAVSNFIVFEKPVVEHLTIHGGCSNPSITTAHLNAQVRCTDEVIAGCAHVCARCRRGRPGTISEHLNTPRGTIGYATPRNELHCAAA